MQVTYIQALYALVLLSNILVLGYLLLKTKKGRRDNRSDDDEGGLELSDIPDLDLPPGVILPQDKPEKEPAEA